MSATFDLTSGPVRMAATGRQPLDTVLDLGDYPDVNVLLAALSLEGTASPAAVIRLLTHYCNQCEAGWVTAATFTVVTASATYEMKQVLAFLRYLRWEVYVLGGTAPAITFSITGVAKGG